MSRYRACDHPSQQGIGKDCTRLGVGIQTAPCFNQECPGKCFKPLLKMNHYYKLLANVKIYISANVVNDIKILIYNL